MPVQSFSENFFMNKALTEAAIAFEENEIPVGAVIVCEDRVIGKGYNQVEKLNDVTAHAEILAITAASNHLGSKYLENCAIYVTLEPCVMCAYAIEMAHIRKIFFGAPDPKKGFTLYTPIIVNPKATIKKGIMEEECSALLHNFFTGLRKLDT
jgi:tRNA(adenine34) deaminase